MTSRTLRAGDTISSSVVVGATPAEVYELVTEVTLIPLWSPECVRCEWLDEATFRGWNRRRFGRWTTKCRVVVAEPGRRFAFAVQLGGGDFTEWTYRMESHPDGCRLTEEFRMCVDLPWAALAFERVALRVRDRRSDLKGNIDQSLRRIRQHLESEKHQGSALADDRTNR